MSLRTHENLSNDRQDAREERWIDARRTGHYQDEFTGGGVPMMIKDGCMVPVPGFIEAAKRRRQRMFGMRRIEHGT